MADPQSTSINAVNDLQARQFIQAFTDYNTAPVLASSDLDLLVTYSRRQDSNIQPPDPFITWQPATAYALGANVVADPRNGSYFTATVGGTTGGTQPTWPTVTGGTVADGSVTWKLGGGAPWNWTWKLATGVKMGWEMKWTRVATVYDFQAGDQRLSRQQMFENIRQIIDFWARKGPEQFKLMGSLRDRSLHQAVTNANDELFIDSWWSILMPTAFGGGVMSLGGVYRGFTGVYPGEQWVDNIFVWLPFIPFAFRLLLNAIGRSHGITV